MRKLEEAKCDPTLPPRGVRGYNTDFSSSFSQQLTIQNYSLFIEKYKHPNVVHLFETRKTTFT